MLLINKKVPQPIHKPLTGWNCSNGSNGSNFTEIRLDSPMISSRNINIGITWYIPGITKCTYPLPSGKHTTNDGKSQLFNGLKQLFLWPFSIAMWLC